MLERICFLIIIIGLISIVCVPLTGGTQKTARVTVIVAGVLWTILQFMPSIPTR